MQTKKYRFSNSLDSRQKNSLFYLFDNMIKAHMIKTMGTSIQNIQKWRSYFLLELNGKEFFVKKKKEIFSNSLLLPMEKKSIKYDSLFYKHNEKQ